MTDNTKCFAVDEYSDWHCVSRDVETHETSKYHRESGMCLIFWNGNSVIEFKKIAEKHDYWVNYNRAELSVIIDSAVVI